MKNALISGAVGLIFMTGGFFLGMRLAHLPPAAKAGTVAPVAAIAAAPKPAFSIETLRKTTQSLLEINQALQAREAAVAAREKRAAEQEQELAAERAALDQSHESFQVLYQEFLKRLQLVKGSEAGQWQRQIEIYGSMDSAQVVDLLRVQDDGTVTKLFSLMDPKPLAKLLSGWKARYPADSPRLLAALNGMGRVQTAEQMTLSATDNAPVPGRASPIDDASPATTTGTPASAGNTDPANNSPSSAASPQVASSKTN